MRHSCAVLLGILVVSSPFVASARGVSRTVARGEYAGSVSSLVSRIPGRAAHALTGSQFVESLRGLSAPEREQAVLHELRQGNMPPFLRRLAPVTLASSGDARRATTVFVMPDYLAIGSDDDFFRIPMNLETATAVASQFGFLLPTRRIVNAVYEQSAFHFVPKPLPAGPQMSSTEYYRRHNALIEEQSRDGGVVPGTLVSGHKKDIVVTNLLARTPGRIAIYGWQRPGGTPIQPLSTVHGACYEDYSHGVRLVSDQAWQNGELRPVREILKDPQVAPVLSDEGAIRSVFAGDDQPAATLATFAPGFCSSRSMSAH